MDCPPKIKNYVLAGLASLLLANCGALGQNKPLQNIPLTSTEHNLSPLLEFAHLYQQKYLPLQQNKDEVTILYPGSGFDISPLEIGIELLHRTAVKKVSFIYTDFGDFQENLPTWHDGLADLTDRIKEELKSASPKLQFTFSGKNYLHSRWIQPTVPQSNVVEYTLNVPTPNGPKQITLTLGYNTFENRAEPNFEEQQLYTSSLLQNARKNYWPNPTESGKIYPTYFLQDQFDKADIILSKQCGDFPLLQFDYVRAATQTNHKRPHIILTEHIDEPNHIKPVIDSLPQFQIETTTLSSHNYGYCSQSQCKVGVIALIPK